MRRSALRAGVIAATAALLTGGVCNGNQHSNENGESTSMSMPQGSRPPAPAVPPVTHDGIRYEEDRSGTGGRLAAVDERTGERLWQLQVYEVPDYQAQGLPAMARYFRSMQLVVGGRELEIENESRGVYRVDLTARTARQVGGPPEVGEPAPPVDERPMPD